MPGRVCKTDEQDTKESCKKCYASFEYLGFVIICGTGFLGTTENV